MNYDRNYDRQKENGLWKNLIGVKEVFWEETKGYRISL
jgi:hypothetical protein